jgi:hypothetical protein
MEGTTKIRVRNCIIWIWSICVAHLFISPDVVQGVEPEWEENMDPLGRTTRRDPDALPPRNMFELILNFVYLELAALGRGNALFAVKAGALTST